MIITLRAAGIALFAAVGFLSFGREQSAAEDALQITSNVNYDVKPDSGPVRVSWDVTLVNNDPNTENQCCGTIYFYDQFSVPVLRGASALAARSSSGESLAVFTGESSGPLTPATVQFGRRIFYTETFAFTLSYELPSAREQSLLVSPSYVYIPAITVGDESTVTINAPFGGTWEVDLESVECEQNANVFTCSGSDSAYLAAIAEVSLPDAKTSQSFDVALKDKSVAVTLSYFQGEDAAAAHIKDVVTRGLPIIEELIGFSYPGPEAVNVSQGGRQVILGYEGLTTCHDTSCDITISPVADDITALHEMAHFWSDVYSKRWLSEGMAQIIAEEVAARLPPDFVQGQPPAREPSPIQLQLDEWGSVTDSIIGAGEDELAVENAGYDRSLRFFYILRAELGFEILKETNSAVAEKSQPVDSQRYLDALENTGNKRVDDLFLEWVFPSSFGPVLEQRREARARLAALTIRAEEEGLSEEVPESIRAEVEAWSFDDAFAALDEAEAQLLEYEELKAEVEALSAGAHGAGLSLPPVISETMVRWNFEGAKEILIDAREAVEVYTAASERVNASRNIWDRFGLIGKDPDGTLHDAAKAFEVGDFQGATHAARDAASDVNGASDVALQRLLIVAAVFAVVAAGIGVAVWYSQRRESEFAEP